MKNKLFVAGCSVSDYTNVNHVYGEHLAKKLNLEYVHEAAGCGSNWRMWRKITGHILAGRLTKNDLLIIQYTDRERKEFWSRHNYEEHCNVHGDVINIYDVDKPKKIQPLRDKYDKDYGNLIRFKLQSYTWQPTVEERDLFKLYEENCINDEYSFEVTNTQNLMFQCLLKEYNIPTIFFGAYCYYYYKRLHIIPHFEKSYFNIDNIQVGEPNKYLIENDNFHFNELGHKYVSEKLLEHIKKNNIYNEQ